jgi:cell division protein FtsA
MARDIVITGIDVGSTAIRIVVGQLLAEDRLHIIGASQCVSEGISKGVIVSIDDAVSSIAGCIEKAERLAGVPIDHAFVSISGAHVTVQASKGVVAVSKADGEIREDDVERVIEAAEAVATPPNYEILHVIPRGYTIDGQSGIKDAVGMTGVRLEVETQIVQGLSAQVKNLTKAIYRTGVDIDDLVLSPLAAAESVLTRQQRDLGAALLVIGGATTGLVVFEDGDVLHTSIIPVGGGHITSDLAIGLRTSIDVAERIKQEHGTALPAKVNKKSEIGLEDVGGADEGTFSKRQAAEIIEARVEEIYDLVNKELKKVHRSGLLPAGIILTGGGAALPGVVELAKKKLRLPATIGRPQGLTTAIEKVHDPSFAVASGLVLWGRTRAKKQMERPLMKRFSSVGDATSKMRTWVRSLIP